LRTNLVSTYRMNSEHLMTTIRTSAELIWYLEGQQIDHLPKLSTHTITNEIDRLIDLMNAVLTISKEDSGKTTFSNYIWLKKCVSI
jgi:signal transduction histidine kinase